MSRRMSVVSMAVLVVVASFALAGDEQSKVMTTKLSIASMPNTLGQALAWVGAKVGMKVHVDARTLQAYKVSLDQKVDMHKGSSSPQAILDTLMVRVSPSGKPLSWLIHDGNILITSQRRYLLIRSGNGPALSSSNANLATKVAAQARPNSSTEYNFDNLSLANVVRFMRSVTKQNFHVNWTSLGQVGITSDTPIQLQLDKVTPARVLDAVCSQLNASRDKFSSVYWVIDRGVVTIATGTALNQKIETRVYDVRHALMPIRNFKSPRTTLSTQRGTDRNNNDDNGNIDFDDDDDNQGGNDDESDLEEIKRLKQNNRDSLIAIIKNALGEDMWQPTGKGSVKVVNGKLIVTQTRLGFKMLDESVRFGQ